MESEVVEDSRRNSVELAAELTIAWLGNVQNRVSADEVPTFLQAMYSAIEQLQGNAQTAPESNPSEVANEAYAPAVSARKSLASPNHIVSMINGKSYRTLSRHLTAHGLTPEAYRARYNLKADYPMVAPSYADMRRAMAQKAGLSGKGRAARAAAQPPNPKAAKPAAEPARNTRKTAKST